MGWISDRHGGEHEGYVIALVTREDTLRGSGVYRALGAPNDRHEPEIERLGAECTCGWRSAHWAPIQREWTEASGERHTLEWAPFSAIRGPADDARAYQEWRRHVADVEARNAERESQGDGRQLRVVARPTPQPDNPAGHICALQEEERCWLRRRPDESGQSVGAKPCDEYRPYCSAPGYCWCGYSRERHARKTSQRTAETRFS